MKMNKQQLEHLSHRLNEKIHTEETNHINSKALRELADEKAHLKGNDGAIQIVGKATKTELQSLLSGFLSASYFNSSMLSSAIRELPSAVTVNNRIEKLDAEMKILTRERDEDIAKLRKKRDAVYDQAVFADSPEAVMEAVEKFMAS